LIYTRFFNKKKKIRNAHQVNELFRQNFFFGVHNITWLISITRKENDGMFAKTIFQQEHFA
jgi:hypothetical protein